MDNDINISNMRDKLDANLKGYTHPETTKPKSKNKYKSFNNSDTPYQAPSAQATVYKKITENNTACSRCQKIACQC
jgi:hypothetical protein